MGERRGAYWFMVRNSEGGTLLGKTRYKWEDNIKMDFREVGWGMNWVDLAEDRDRWRAVVNVVMNLREP
jgi:hypothetical protein